MNTDIGGGPSYPPFRPGFLLGPLAWLTERLSPRLGHEPELLSLLFGLEPYAMHLLGIALAHGCNERLMTLFRQAPRALVEQSISHWPEGLDRLVYTLPAMALSPEEYRAIPQLLSDRPTAKYLQHQRSIDGPMIAGLSALPPALRQPAIFNLFGRFERMDRFVRGLRFLSVRAGLAFDSMVSELGALDQTDQVIARIADVVDGLPLPVSLPPPFVGLFRRIDDVGEIKKLAKTWDNCLADYLHTVNDGTGAVYQSDADGLPAVAFVLRYGRLGWLLNQIKGPKNIDIEASRQSSSQNAFLEAGIPTFIDMAAIKDLVVQTRWERRLGN